MEPTDRELLQKNLKIAEDTNRTVHKLRRGMVLGRLVTILFWLVIMLGPVVAYFYYYQSYIQPYMQKIEQLYTQMQQGNKQAQNYQSQISNFFGNLTPQSTSTTVH